MVIRHSEPDSKPIHSEIRIERMTDITEPENEWLAAYLNGQCTFEERVRGEQEERVKDKGKRKVSRKRLEREERDRYTLDRLSNRCE